MDIAIGLLLLLGPSARTASPSFSVAKAIMPVQAWGVLFIVLGHTLLVAVQIGREMVRERDPKALARDIRLYSRVSYAIRVIGPTLFVMWATMFVVAAIEAPAAGFAGIPTYLFLAFRHSFAPVGRERRLGG